MTDSSYKYLFVAGLLSLAASAITFFADAKDWAAPLLILGLPAVAFGMRRY